MILAILLPCILRLVIGSGAIACPPVGYCTGSVDGEMVVRCFPAREHEVALGREELP